jgi:hypothetical protein
MTLRRSVFSWFAFAALATLPFLALGRGEDSPRSYERVLFLGNSITLHGPLESIGWTGNWGMAASSRDQDYVHLLLQRLAKSQGGLPESLVQNIADFERDPEAYDLDTTLRDAIAFDPDLVIIAIGENVPALPDEAAQEKFRAAFGQLLDHLAGGRSAVPRRILVRGTFWPDARKDAAMRTAAVARDCTFVPLGDLGSDPRHAAASERDWKHAGVGAHPGDRGMLAIADAIWLRLNASPSPVAKPADAQHP